MRLFRRKAKRITVTIFWKDGRGKSCSETHVVEPNKNTTIIRFSGVAGTKIDVKVES